MMARTIAILLLLLTLGGCLGLPAPAPPTVRQRQKAWQQARKDHARSGGIHGWYILAEDPPPERAAEL